MYIIIYYVVMLHGHWLAALQFPNFFNEFFHSFNIFNQFCFVFDLLFALFAFPFCWFEYFLPFPPFFPKFYGFPTEFWRKLCCESPFLFFFFSIYIWETIFNFQVKSLQLFWKTTSGSSMSSEITFYTWCHQFHSKLYR